jgi:hypothetical protein
MKSAVNFDALVITKTVYADSLHVVISAKSTQKPGPGSIPGPVFQFIPDFSPRS